MVTECSNLGAITCDVPGAKWKRAVYENILKTIGRSTSEDCRRAWSSFKRIHRAYWGPALCGGVATTVWARAQERFNSGFGIAVCCSDNLDGCSALYHSVWFPQCAFCTRRWKHLSNAIECQSERVLGKTRLQSPCYDPAVFNDI